MSYASARQIDESLIPVIDIGPLRDGSGAEEVAHALHRASREVGFIYVANHGIAAEDLAAARQTALDFFRRDEAEKAEVKVTTKHRGWLATGGAKMQDDAKPDLKESYIWGYQDDAGQTPDGTLATEQTSTRIEIANNRFEGRKVSGGKSFRGIGIKIKNVVETVVKNNKFTGSWNYPIQTSFGSVGSGNKSKLGHYGSKHPKKILMQGNDFGKGGNLDLAGRGRGSSDTFEVRSNKGSVSCTVGTMQTHGSSINNQINWGTVNRSKPRLNQSGNSFKCN